MQKPLLSASEQAQIVEAIRTAEMATSGEVRVHIEAFCPETDVLERAKEVFAELGMHRTDLKNGVLFYLAINDRKFAVLGDQGINERVPDGFWNEVRDLMRYHFIKQAYGDGLGKGIVLAGEQLKTYFPRQNNDINELPDDISFG
ncbi:MAG: TPM domain-containing protein [Spirosomataceae bacterium]